MSVRDDLNAIFRTVFDDDTIDIDPEMSANDIYLWDSFSHVTLLMSVEEHFEITFTSREMMNLTSVGALQALIEKKLAAK